MHACFVADSGLREDTCMLFSLLTLIGLVGGEFEGRWCMLASLLTLIGLVGGEFEGRWCILLHC